MWRFVIGRAKGTSHIAAGFPCQDRLDFRVVENCTLVAAIADGAGSASLAERGANMAVKTVADFLSSQLDAGRLDYGAILREAAAKAREAVVAEARHRAIAPREFASTLLAVIAGPEDGGALQIGDGAIVVSGGDGWNWVFCPQRGMSKIRWALWPQRVVDDNQMVKRDWEFRWVFWPQRGEYANTTRFLTDADALECLLIAPRLGKVTDIALMTDGLESVALHYPSRSAYEPFFHGIFRPLTEVDEAVISDDREIKHLSASLDRFLTSGRVRSRTDDDVSLILASWRQ